MASPSDLIEQLATKHRAHTLPWSPDDQWAAPADLLRCALFRPHQGSRTIHRNEQLASWGDTEVQFTGETLDQSDLDVWLGLVRNAQTQGTLTIEIRVKGFLKNLGRSVGKPNRQWLQASINRLQIGSIRVVQGDSKRYQGSLVDAFYQDDETGKYWARLNPELTRLFFTTTWIDKQARLSLGRKQLAKALHGFISSHRASAKDPLIIGSQKLHKLFGSGYKHPRTFRQDLRQALNHLVAQNLIHRWSESSNGRITIQQ